MTRKLEELFDLPIDEPEVENTVEEQDPQQAIVSIEDAISTSEKINAALSEVRGMEVHDTEMDEIAQAAMESYDELMRLGMNMTDMAAGGAFNNAAAMLKIALEAKDSKVSRKLKQIDLMLKKANLDHRVEQASKKDGDDDEDGSKPRELDRNQMLRLFRNKDE